MKRLEKTALILMTSMIVILSISMPVQAKTITDGMSNDVATVTPRTDLAYPTMALITGSDVSLRETPSLLGEVVQTLQQGYFVQINTEDAVEVDGITWYPCKYAYVYGYVDSRYVRIIG